MFLNTSIANRLHLRPAEFTMLIVAVFALLINFCLIFYKGANVDYAAYTGILLAVTVLSTIGYFYRLSGRSENIASGLICASIFIFFSGCMALFNYLLLPVTFGPFDHILANVDSYFGFYWPDIMALATHYPLFTLLMKWAYMSTMIQFALLVAILGLSGRTRDLHVMITSVTITATLTICFWGIFPTTGTTTIYEIPLDVWMAVNPPVDRNYALELITIVKQGPSLISPKEIRGLIAFPSYHAVLAFTAMYAARNLKVLGPIFFVINLLILPSIFVHGGHHFVDLPAGLLMFLFGTYLALKTAKKYKIPERQAALSKPQSNLNIA